MPFPLSDTDIKTEGLYSDEEERISILSNKLTKQESHHNSFVPAIMIPVSRHPSARQSIGPTESVHRGSFYGRRDFENKHDDTSDIAVGSVNNSKLCRKPSTLDNVLTRIKSMKNSDQSDESEAEFYDDYDDDDDDDDFEDYYDGREN